MLKFNLMFSVEVTVVGRVSVVGLVVIEKKNDVNGRKRTEQSPDEYEFWRTTEKTEGFSCIR
jgi:hypothetical protein